MSKKIFLVDDDEIHSFILETYTKKVSDGFSVEKFINAEKALNALRAIAETKNEFPNFIFIDLDMPVMNGFEFLEVYDREFYPQFPDVNLYFLSSSMNENEEKTILKSPAVISFINKPISLDTYKKCLEEKIQKMKSVQ
ncbi:response regulator [Aureibacter tunicatorum]|uniref:CheY-like chemotaxis protein n=1 Tax=Aureibacter tunicatorum TaxID=866807 RepID=A0AAE4BQF2_9BACT|nr:response regulator [Aureibacter tunicatorum]MDR6237491.1 CheY-like chemotaxis protein [Aureibacter tunicatorum]BDD02525.1 hypothetical protein AUTU_00080 [Aureibacter tunicatorum]